MIRRGFVPVGGRRVHYRVAGSGQPVVMLHGSPGDSEMFGGEMAAFASGFTAIALDTPGFGFSEPLPGEVLRVSDLAEATAGAMAALGLPPSVVYGSHTGAAIGLELGVGWPERVSGLVLEGVPLFTPAETEAIFRGYFAPMVPDPLGGHLISTWMRFRDQFTWFPWCSRDVTRLNPLDRPRPEDIHHWVSMFYRSCRTYGPAYKAACYYGQAAGYRAAEALTVPAVYTASASDMLHPHLSRLPPLKPGQRVAELADGAGRYDDLVGFARSLPGGAVADVRPGGDPVGGLCFVAVPDGEVLVRYYGDRSRPAVLLAHDAPGTGLGCEALAIALAGEFFLLVPDLPGCGESSAAVREGLEAAGRDVPEAAADALVAVADRFGLVQYAVVGLGCGAAVCACLKDARVAGIVAKDVPAPDATVAAAIAPDIRLSAEGAHWVQAWLMVRDAQIYRPWFDGTVAAQRHDQGNFDAQWLHDQTCALMAGRESYHLLPRAAWGFDTLAALHRVWTTGRKKDAEDYSRPSWPGLSGPTGEAGGCLGGPDKPGHDDVGQNPASERSEIRCRVEVLAEGAGDEAVLACLRAL